MFVSRPELLLQLSSTLCVKDDGKNTSNSKFKYTHLAVHKKITIATENLPNCMFKSIVGCSRKYSIYTSYNSAKIIMLYK